MKIYDQKIYSGEFIHNHGFIYKYYRDKVLPIGNIITFVAPAEVTTGLIDLEDSLEKDYIYSEKMVHFCWGVPNMSGMGSVAFQRLFMVGIGNILHKFIKQNIEMKGDDIIVNAPFLQGGIHQTKGKASVSITYSKDGFTIGHAGVNIVAGKKAPAFAYSTNLSDEDTNKFQDEVQDYFYQLVDSLFVSSVKVIV